MPELRAMDAMDRVFTCPECGQQTPYQPEEWALFTRFKATDNKVKAFSVRLVCCAG
jgi:hypothetical protein